MTNREVEIIDDECPLGTLYRVSAAYARSVDRWAPLIADDAGTVLIRHPSTDKRDMPVTGIWMIAGCEAQVSGYFKASDI